MLTTKKVWVNGTFDILHRGHIELFKFARNQGDYLSVGIDTDRRIKEKKGKNRPVNTQLDRKYFLEAIKYIDEVVIFDSATELINLVAHHQPDFMVVGEEYKNKEVIGGTHAKEIKYFRKIGEYSTTKILQNSFSGR